MGDRLVTIDIGQKLGGAVPLLGGELGPHVTQCSLRTNWHLDPSSHLITTAMGQN